MRAAQRFAGWTLDELARVHGSALTPPASRDKGYVGRLLERALGLPRVARAAQDFESLGVELKTLPVGCNAQPRESTFVCYVPLASLADTPWEHSRVALKLTRVLFVPIESDKGLATTRRRIGCAFLWSPSPEQARLLREDYAALAARVAAGDLERLDARAGSVLQLRPKAAHGGVRIRMADGEGAPVLAQPRAFYLRASFTATLIRAVLDGT